MLDKSVRTLAAPNEASKGYTDSITVRLLFDTSAAVGEFERDILDNCTTEGIAKSVQHVRSTPEEPTRTSPVHAFR